MSIAGTTPLSKLPTSVTEGFVTTRTARSRNGSGGVDEFDARPTAFPKAAPRPRRSVDQPVHLWSKEN